MIGRIEPDALWVNGEPHRASVVVPWSGNTSNWQADSLESLTQEHFDRLIELKPEVVIFGSGRRLRFVAPSLIRTLIAAQIGLETMTTAAACRTFNVLATEGRHVVAALLLEAAG